MPALATPRSTAHEALSKAVPAEPQTPSPPGRTEYRDNADMILPITIDVNSPDGDDQIRQVARTLCPFLLPLPPVVEGFSGSDSENENETVVEKGKAVSANGSLSIKPLLGGTSNELFIVSRRLNRGAWSVLVRIHPEGGGGGSGSGGMKPSSSDSCQVDTDPLTTTTTPVVDREVENQLVAWLSRQAMAPIFYGRFANGRVEEFYENVVPLSCPEMVTFGPQIATAMADFHALDVSKDLLPLKSSRVGAVQHWMDAIQSNNHSNNNIMKSPHTAMIDGMVSEWQWLRTQLLSETTMPTTSSSSQQTSDVEQRTLIFLRQMVVTHMDCQSLNILKCTTPDNVSACPSIRLIDFEYAGWNPRAADLANTFCEHCDMTNLRADYEREYPSVPVQSTYLTTYVRRAHPDMAKDLDDTHGWEECLETMRHEVGRWTLLSHLGWKAWSILKVQEGSGGIDFDYLAYAKHRMEGYEWHKKQFFSVEFCE